MAEQEHLVSSLSSLALRNFTQTCKSPDTRLVYTKALHHFMNYLRIPKGNYDRLIDKDPKIIQTDICDYITYLRNGHSSASVALYVAALNKFYTMNDVLTLNWKKIKSFQGEREKVVEDRPYTHSEIKMLLDKASLRNRAIILLMCSSGVRVGALPTMRVKDLEPINKYNTYKINVYPRSRNSYFSYCIPECRVAIDSYLDWRKRYGERIKDESPLFRRDFNAHGPKVSNAKTITRSTIIALVDKLWRDAGLKNPSIELEGQSDSQNQNHRRRRYHIMGNHGFRKFMETNAFKAGMDNMYIRRLLGQKSGLEDSYLKLSEEDLLEGDSRHVGYIGIMDALTIDESHRLKREVQTLKQEMGRFEHMSKEIEELKLKIEGKLR